MTLEAAVRFVEDIRRHGKIVVFTNGVYDLLHPGHVRYLKAARALGDALIVGVNSDRSVRAIKGPSTSLRAGPSTSLRPGPSRPITPELERVEILSALECVDAAVVFDEDTPAEIIKAIQPDILVKGADWAENAIVGRDTVEARGGRVVRMPIEEGWSTTSILSRIQKPG